MLQAQNTLTSYQRLLVLLDVSRPCDRIIDESLSLARRLDASLYGLVVEPSALGSDSQCQAEALVHQFILKGHRSPANEVLSGFLEKGKATGLEINGSVLSAGAVVRACVQAVATTRSDVIVMGQGFRAGLLDFVLGPVALRIARSAACPVLLVVEEAEHVSSSGVPDGVGGLGFL